MLEHLRIYLRLQLLHLRSHMEYEADFWVAVLGIVLAHGVGFVFLWSVYAHVPTVAGFDRTAAVALYAAFVLAKGIVDLLFDGAWMLTGLVNRGELDRLFVRPFPAALQVLAAKASPHGAGSIVTGLVLLAGVGPGLGIDWTLGRVVYAPLAVLNGAIVLGATGFAVNCVCLWEPAARHSFPLAVADLGELAKYPLPIYDQAIQWLLTWCLPFGFVAYLPARALLEPGELTGPAWLLLLSGPACLGLARIVWRRGLRRYQGTGT